MTVLTEIVYGAYDIHRSLLSSALHTHDATGSCLHAAILLHSMVTHFCPDATALIRGGNGSDDGYYLDANGRKHGHYWIEISTGRNSFVADITADQFGDDAPILLPVRKAAQYHAGCQQVVDEHVAGEMHCIQTARQASA